MLGMMLSCGWLLPATVTDAGAMVCVYAPQPVAGANPQTMAPASVTVAGNSQPHDNIMPSMAMNYIIALYGIYPSRN